MNESIVRAIRNVAQAFLFASLVPLCAAPFCTTAFAQALRDVDEHGAGDSPGDPGPLANDLSGKLSHTAVTAAMRKVADWQLTRVNDEASQDWTFATLYLGLLEASNTLHDPRYMEHVQEVAEHYRWTLGPRKTHADDQAIGQSYLWLYNRNPYPKHIAPLRQQFDEVMREQDDPQKPVWWWCDALFMAPPVWAHLASVTHNGDYLGYMDREWHITANLLWDPEEHLFFRDNSYFDKREKNGRKIFWSRGNGWVMGGLAQVLTYMPEKDPRRPFYIEKFRQMAEKLRLLQGEDGLWRPGLLDAVNYPYPEISGSAFFVYSMAWGIHHGLLEEALFRPVVERGWNGLVKHIYEDGRLGSIQRHWRGSGRLHAGLELCLRRGRFFAGGFRGEPVEPMRKRRD